jgi:hypothetical protein
MERREIEEQEEEEEEAKEERIVLHYVRYWYTLQSI